MNESNVQRLRRLAQEAEARTVDRLQTAHADYLVRLSQVCSEEFSQFQAQAVRLSSASPFERMNQAAQRMLRAGNREAWGKALLDAAPGAVLFEVQGDSLRRLGGDALTMPLASAPALASAAESGETVVVLRSASELSAALAGILEDEKAYVVPVRQGGQTTAVLVAGFSADIHALELLALVGANVAEPAPVVAEPTPLSAPDSVPSLIQIGNAKPATQPEPTAADYRARRFATAEVSRLLLERPQEVESGRKQRDLYGVLRDTIETSRAAYRQQYISTLPRRVDYFHEELIRTLANDDESLLGPEYPGPLS